MTADAAAVLAMPIGEAAESLALGALDWLLGSAQATEEGLTWVAAVPGTEPDFTLYHGAAGIVLALLEAQQHFGDDRYGDAATRVAAAIAAAAGQEEDCSLYFGLTGMAVALHAVHVQLGGSSTDGAARRVWATPASSANCCGSPAPAPEESRPMRFPGRTILARPGMRCKRDDD